MALAKDKLKEFIKLGGALAKKKKKVTAQSGPLIVLRFIIV